MEWETKTIGSAVEARPATGMDLLEHFLANKVRTTPISGSGSIYAQSLIARGFADTRATKIGEAIDNDDMLALAYAIGACDNGYFKWLVKNEPVLFLYFKSRAEHLPNDWRRFSERIQEVLDKEEKANG